VRHRRSLPSAGVVLAATLVPLALLVAACGNHGTKAVEASEPVPTPSTALVTTTPPPPVGFFPLTGLPLTDLAAAAHPTVAVKMDNSPQARPQTGINQADIVFEERVEGITRYAVVFHSTAPETVGPVRSARSSDIDLIAGLAKPLLAWSGGNPTVTKQVQTAANAGLLVDASQGANPPEYWRDNARQAPHNLYTSVPQLLAKFGGGSVTPPQAVLPYGVAGAALSPTAVDAPGVMVDFGNHVQAEYVWDAERKGWDRFQVDELHGVPDSATLDSDGTQVSPTNVVVLSIPYVTSAADVRSPQAITVGSGDGYVLTQGKVVAIKWARAANTAPFTFTTPDGQPVTLTPGRTWVALPLAGAAVLPLDRAGADSWLAVRK